MATIDDIVRESGVSRSTVFRFLNGSNVRNDAKSSIVSAMEKLNYNCEALYKQKKVTLEISISSNFESFKGFADAVQGIIQRADEEGISVNICRRTGHNIVDDYSNWNTDTTRGVIVVGKNLADEEVEAKMLTEKGIPHVFINRIFDTDGVNYVSVDVKKAAYEAVNYLISNGHKKIATIGVPYKLRIDKHKMEGYKEALLKNGIEIRPEYCKELTDNENWEKIVEEILKLEDRPTAFFGICDSYAMRFIHIAHNNGFKVPEDIAVLGMDDVDNAEYFKPALSTVHIPFKKMGILAVDNILKLMSDSDISSLHTTLNHRLLIRESCGTKQN